MERLEEYRRKRNFQRTPEPAGPEMDAEAVQESVESGQFVIQKHAARRLHYDLRLERDGVFKSWAVPKGPSLKPGEKRLAVQVEDHPLEYGDFEGVIPPKEYGGGTVMLWDRGRWAALERKGRHRRKASDDHIDFVLFGEKLRGAWTLVRTAGEGNNWLLIKRHDTAAEQSQLTDLSVATGRTMDQIAADRNRTWTRTGEVKTENRQVPTPSTLTGARKKSLPRNPEPQLATLVREAPADESWLHELKYDGYRILARRDGGAVKLISRNGRDWTTRFSEIAALLKNLAGKTALLDGEIVIVAADGTTSFRALQDAIAAKNTAGVVFQVFDLIHLDGYDLSGVSLLERKRVLSELLSASGFTQKSPVRYCEHLQGQGPAFSEHACRLGLEGIICKRADSRYRSGRGRDWLKVKCTAQEELIVCGFTKASGTRAGFRSLLLGAWSGGKLIYAGRVGTGFSERVHTELDAQLRKLRVEKSPLHNPPDERDLQWVRPQLVAEVEFSEWTRDGVLRHPVFRGLREDRDPSEILLPQAASTQKPEVSQPPRKIIGRKARGGRDTAEVAGVTLTNAGRVLYPEQGITKLALAHYYEAIEPWLLPQLSFRPLSLVRCPEGYTQECFFQKHPRKTVDKNVPRVMIEEKDGPSPYLYVRSLSDVIALVQIGALELHVWGSRVDHVEQPDLLVFDLDPAADVPLGEIMRVARDLRDRLADLGLTSFPRTTGGKGLHLVVPIVPERGWDEVKAFCHAVARQHAQDDPTRVTSNMAKAKRRGRIFIDYLRNGRGATAIASYSTRARTGAPVAVPVAWDELTQALRPDRYNLENLHRRLAVLKQDPWHDLDAARRPLSSDILRAVGIEGGETYGEP